MDKIEDSYATTTKSKKGDLNTVDEECLKPLDKEDFLKQFPKTYIKNGKVVSVRDEIAKKIDGKTDIKSEEISKKNDLQKSINLMTHYYIQNKDFQDGILEITSNNLKNKKENDENNVTILKIRTEDGKKTLILKLLPNETMAIVYEIISSVM